MVLLLASYVLPLKGESVVFVKSKQIDDSVCSNFTK